MPKVKIVQAGMETYTGLIGAVEFKKGVSVTEVPDVLMDRIAASIKLEYYDGDNAGKRAGSAQRLLDSLGVRAKVEDAPEKLNAEVAELERLENEVKRKNPPKILTRDELEEVASKKGIAGLREIGDPINVRARAIPDLLKALEQAMVDAVARDREAAGLRKRLEDQGVIQPKQAETQE